MSSRCLNATATGKQFKVRVLTTSLGLNLWATEKFEQFGFIM